MKKLRLSDTIKKDLNEVDYGGNKNELDNRLFVALNDLAQLCSYLGDAQKKISNKEVNKFRNELRQRYKRVDEYIEKYAK
jgi:hypothetical protein